MAKEQDEVDTPIVIDREPHHIAMPESISMSTPFEAQKEIEVQMANAAIEVLYIGLTTAKSVSGICRAVDAIFNAIERRRHIMMRPYGHRDKNTKGNTIELLD